jgi:RimJ/RimL family protein N-acetyltransferase
MELLQGIRDATALCTPQYARAMESLGYEAWIVAPDDADTAAAAIGYIRRGKLAATLEFPSLPRAAESTDFWRAVDMLAARAGVTDISAGTFGSPEFVLPTLKGEVSRRERQEFVLLLRATDWRAALSTNHKRNIKKAAAASIAVQRSNRSANGLSDHLRLMAQSQTRRATRGEPVAMDLSDSVYRALLDHEAAELFQAVRDGEIVSSVLVLRSPSRAYYHSAGSSPDGMKTGASHFLIHEIARTLEAEGIQEFNLGGAPEGSTLARFKQGFGGRVLSLNNVECHVGPKWKRTVRELLILLKNDPRRLLRLVTGSSTRLLVFGVDTSTALPVPAIDVPEARFEPMTDEQLRAVAAPPDDPGFRTRQLERLERFKRSYAWAVYAGDTLTHISWLLPPPAVAVDVPSVLELSTDEAEITACETLPSFRGKGIYTYAIHNLVTAARNQGIARIYMKTAEANVGSQTGIRKAGLKPIGSIRIIQPPLRPSRMIVKRDIAW